MRRRSTSRSTPPFAPRRRRRSCSRSTARACKEAREQAEDIVTRSRKAADTTLEEAKAAAKEYSEEQRAATLKDIEAAKQLALDDIRKEVADLTVIATEKVTRKSLDDDDHRRLIEDALSEVDFSALSGSEGRS